MNEDEESDEESLYSAASFDSQSSSLSSQENLEPMGPFNSRLQEEEGQASPVEVTFNRSLPGYHQYLGTDLEEVTAGQNVFDDDSIVENIPLLPIPHFVLMPNQILPLNKFHPQLISMFRTIIANARCFGVTNAARDTTEEEDNHDSDSNSNVDIGTLAQVLAFKEETEHELTAMKMRVVGRQRFRVISAEVHNGILIGKLRILPDVEVPDFMHDIDPFYGCKKTSKGAHLKVYQKALLACIHVPSFVPAFYDTKLVVSKVVQELKQWYDVEQLQEMSHNATAFSFWVASNLPISNQSKLFLLSLNCGLQRLRYELSLMQQCTSFFCRECHARLGHKKHVFSMSYMGPLGVYVNPYGSLHELFTLNRLDAPSCVNTIGRAHTEFSWFPGYSWTIMQCSRCHSHVGWKFKIEKDFHFEPKEFYGVTRSSIYPRFDRELDEELIKPFM